MRAAQLGVLAAPRVTVIASRAYAAAKEVWGVVEQPLDGTRGIGQQLARLAAIAATPRPVRGRQVVPVPAPVDVLPGSPVQLALFDPGTWPSPPQSASSADARCEGDRTERLTPRRCRIR